MKKLDDFESLYPNINTFIHNQEKIIETLPHEEYFRMIKSLTPEERFLLFIFSNSRYGIVYEAWKGKSKYESRD